MSDNNGKGWVAQYLNSTGEISTNSSPVEEDKYFEKIAQEIIIASEQYAKHNIQFSIFQLSMFNWTLTIESRFRIESFAETLVKP